MFDIRVFSATLRQAGRGGAVTRLSRGLAPEEDPVRPAAVRNLYREPLHKALNPKIIPDISNLAVPDPSIDRPIQSLPDRMDYIHSSFRRRNDDYPSNRRIADLPRIGIY